MNKEFLTWLENQEYQSHYGWAADADRVGWKVWNKKSRFILWGWNEVLIWTIGYDNKNKIMRMYHE